LGNIKIRDKKGGNKVNSLSFLAPLYSFLCTFVKKAMATYTITINDRTNKTKHLLGLIKEIAKTETKYISVEHSPNAETIKALEDAKLGRVTKTKGKKDFFAKLNS
jgi:hypothetical protein